MIPEDRADRIEQKVDKLTEAVQKLVLIEERQLTQGQRIGECEKKMAVLEERHDTLSHKVEAWINRGIGAWGVATLIATLVTLYFQMRP